MSGIPDEETSHLLALPAELREQIYRLILSPAANRISWPDEYDTYDYGAALALLLVSRQVYYEARAAFRALNVFVKIETPWPEAQDHVEVEGHVPILLKGRRAARFRAHTLAVTIEAPLMGGGRHGEATAGGGDAADFSSGGSGSDDDDNGDDAPGTAEPRFGGIGGRGGGRRHWNHNRAQHFVILLDDLPKFTRTWFYSDLSNPGLNRYLGLRLQLRDPYPYSLRPAAGGEDKKATVAEEDEGEEEKQIPVALQRRLLLPFGDVKGLARLQVVTGNPTWLAPLAEVEAELRALQAVPPASPEKCLTEATRLKAEGNALLTAGNPRAALEVYSRAWEAIHIIVRGRQRHVHAEAYFARRLGGSGGGGGSSSNSSNSEGEGEGQGEEEPVGDGDDQWRGRNGAMERLILRVQLVANTCLAYLKLGMWEEVCFWGMRSIGMMRQARLAGPMMNGNGIADMDIDIPPEEEAILGFPGAIQMGKIYYRTAIAYKELDDKTWARKLLRVAHVYLPMDEHVKRELAACALRLG
ncbi:hypothetical protein SLS62_000778 [Diatrype stigma]|uniref:Uncharacterized protein n=1 Tax=Diatrype stigma TaxID=117547 RepID=A0AAN9V9W9_9PEZI